MIVNNSWIILYTFVSYRKDMEKKKRHIAIRLLRVLLWTAGIWIILLSAAQLILSSSAVNRLVDRYASGYIDGKLEFSKVRVDMFRHFPNIGISIEDGSLTYPSERFAQLRQESPQGRLLYSGCGEESDTLASFRYLSAGINVTSLLAGKISIPHIRMVKPRIFAHSFDSTNVNWDIFRLPEDDDTTSAALPPISIGRIRLSDHPHIVYTDSEDTLFAMIDVKQIGFNGKLDTRKVTRNRIGLTFDSMIVAGRIASDTLGLRVDMLHIHEHHDHMDIHTEANALLATNAFGRINVPISIKGTAGITSKDPLSVALHDFSADIASMPIDFDLDISHVDEGFSLDGRFGMKGCKVEDLIDGFIKNIVPETADIRTDAVISISGSCNGVIGNGGLPSFEASLSVPHSEISHKKVKHKINIALDAGAETDDKGKVNVSVENIDLSTYGLYLNAGLQLSDLLGEDPLIKVDSRLRAAADSLATFLPEDHAVNAEGGLSAELKGSIRLSQMDIYNFGQAELTGSIRSDELILDSPADTISVSLKDAAIGIAPESKTSKTGAGTFRLLGINGAIGKIGISLKEAAEFNGTEISFAAKNSVDALSGENSSKVHPLGGHLDALELNLKDGNGMSVTLDNTSNSFQMVPKRDNPEIPILSLKSSNKRIYLRDLSNRVILTDAGLEGRAVMNTAERRTRRRINSDSASFRPQRKAREIPEWMTEESFRASDINFSLDGMMAENFRKGEIEGGLKVRTGIFMTPYLPLRNILKGTDIDFNNNELRINEFKIVSGNSEIAAKGSLSGLRRALLGRGSYNLDMDITSGKMNADELLAAFNAGMSYNPDTESSGLADASDSEFLKMVVSDTLETDQENTLIIVPADLNADIRVKASDMTFSDLHIDSLRADILMKERCMQITNSKALTNMGEAELEGFYSTRTKKDIRAGFNFNLNDVTSERVIAMMPAIDTIMPLLKSFSGMIDCQLAATASLDTRMNILTPSINGVVRIGGENLLMKDNEVFSSIARKLKFKNRKEGRIDKMTVEGVIKDNTLEVFPFIVDLDRYTLALSGIHNMDMSYRYHVSIIRSPIVFKVGVDIFGPDFDNMKFRIGKPKYRTTDVPVFTAVIDQTRVNLAESIRGIFEKGVEIAVKENEMQDIINDHKKNIGYVNAADQTLEELSAEEQRQLEEGGMNAEETLQVDSLSISKTLNEMIINRNIKDEQPGIH